MIRKFSGVNLHYKIWKEVHEDSFIIKKKKIVGKKCFIDINNVLSAFYFFALPTPYVF